jgi:RNA polymerase sigma-70 factor, ECF subfamily
MTVIAGRGLGSSRIGRFMVGRSVAIEPEQTERSRALDSRTPAQTFEGIYDDHYRDVYRYVLLSLRRRDDTDDVVADTFGRAFAAWRSGHGPSGRALPWLLLIARRIIVDRWRRERLLRLLPLGLRGRSEGEVADVDDSDGRTEFWLWLEQLAAALPDRQREVLFLRYQRDLSDEDIGEVLGLSASGVRTLVSRAIAALRAHPELWS